MPSQVLIVDDCRTVRTQLRGMLGGAGYEVDEASDGRAAIVKAREAPPDVIVLDIQMPEMDGYGVCQELKNMGSPWDRIPILFLTSLDSNALNLLGSAMGTYLRKPVGVDELLDSVASLVSSAVTSPDM
jgi:DNA-binding response OmpR family regulator